MTKSLVADGFPENEAARRVAATDLHETSSPGDPDLTALVRVAAMVCGTPISLVTLVGTEAQWFQAQLGLDGMHETPRDVAFCAHTILQDRVLEI
ncbi:MAG: hypothetical protein B7Z31_04415, partial [Rhodobacterales bacterium 12-65-15]